MIAISEKGMDILSIKSKHTNFVENYTEPIITFYIEIFNLLLNIEGKAGVTDRCIIREVERIKNETGCGNYKKLLQAILKRSSRVTSLDHAAEIKKEKNRIYSRTDIKKVKTLLETFLTEYKIFLNIELHDNSPLTLTEYQNLCHKYALLGPLIDYVFDYEDWFLKLPATAEWGPYQLTGSLETNTCPYCNRQYTFTVFQRNGNKISRPALDHFLPKSRHPFLALSFYNLIPACTVCNSGLKGALEISYSKFLNPYEENDKHGLMRFTYIPEDYESSIGLGNRIKIEAQYAGDPDDQTLNNKVNGNISLFSLNELYHNHRDIVQEIIWKRHHANDHYISILQRMFKKFDLSTDDAYRFAYGNYYKEKDFYKRTLSKLTKDIAIELGSLIKY